MSLFACLISGDELRGEIEIACLFLATLAAARGFIRTLHEPGCYRGNGEDGSVRELRSQLFFVTDAPHDPGLTSADSLP